MGNAIQLAGVTTRLAVISAPKPAEPPPPALGAKPEEHPEFSEIGRDPRFPSGWWMPVAVVLVVIAVIIIV